MLHRHRFTVAIIVALLSGLPAYAKEDAANRHVGSHAAPLSPEEARKHFKVPPGFEVRLFAAEPDVINPVAMSFDEKGRLWVVEAYEYPNIKPKGETRKGRDRVICLESPNGEEHATKRTVVVEDLWLASAITYGNGGIYVGQTPNLYFIPITETPQGPKAGEREILLTGFGDQDQHELLNSFCWGPDGWLYFTQGVFTRSLVRDPKNPNDKGTKIDAGVFRYNTRTRKFEIFADGISNQWGVDWDRYGNMFVSACVIDHIWHVVPGGVYVRQGGTPNIPYTYGLLGPINKDHHRHHLAAYSGINIYQGNLFPEEYRGYAYMGNIHGNCIDRDKLTPDGSSWTATDTRTPTDSGEFLEANDDWFRPVSLQTGPDGAMWIMDWYDKYPCYQNAHAPDLDRERGRIWRLVYTGKEPGKAVPTHEAGMDLGKLPVGSALRTEPAGDAKTVRGADPTPTLASSLSHPNVWQRRTARRVLRERLDSAPTKEYFAGVAAFERMMRDSNNSQQQLELLWMLSSLKDGADISEFTAADSPSATLRSWSARAVGNKPTVLSLEISMLSKLAHDSDPAVLAAVAEAAHRCARYGTTPIIVTLLKQPGIDKDPQLPFLIWRATEPSIEPRADGGLFESSPSTGEKKLSNDPDRAHILTPQERAESFGEASLSDGAGAILRAITKEAGDSVASSGLVRKITHRLLDANSVKATQIAIDFIKDLNDDHAALATAAVQGLLDAQGNKKIAPPGAAGLDLAKLRASKNPELVGAANQLAARWGNAAAAEAGLKMIGSPDTTRAQLLQAVTFARHLDSDPARAALLRIVTGEFEPAVQLEAIRALGEIGKDDAAGAILAAFKRLPAESRKAAGEVMTTRLAWAKALLAAVQAKQVAPEDVSATAFRNLSRQKDKDLAALVSKTVGRYRAPDADKLEVIAAKKAVLLNGPVDLEAGHKLAQQTCFVCHSFYGEGMHVGPDLTGVGRSTIDALLHNVIDPNEIIGAGYENTLIETKDNRSLSGRLIEDTADHIKLLSAGDKEDVVSKADIASQRTEKISVMPEGLVDSMPDQDLRNLLWYIYSPKQDNKDHKLRIDLSDKKLLVSAKLPGLSEMIPLLDYVTDSAKRPYIHPLRDPSGQIVMTQDAPPDHLWQHGIFTGLHDVSVGTDPAKLDFWSEKTDRQHFVKLLDVTEANDHVGWRSLTNWVSAAGGTVLEEEQSVTVYAVDSPDSYRVDFDWTLRAKGKPVKIGGFDYGGFSVRLNTASGHTHLNSGGEKGAEVSNHEARWNDITVPFGDRQAGVAVLDHPANPGAPSKWRVDGQGMVNPSPSLKGNWSIEAGKEKTFHYRLIVHSGPASLEQLNREFNQFGASPVEPSAGPGSK